MSRLRPPVLLVLFFVVNALITVHIWLPGPWPLRAFIPVVEAVVLVAIVVASTRFSGKRALISAAAAILVLAAGMVFSSAEALFQYIWGRPFLFRADVPMIRGGLLLILGDIGSLVDRLVPPAIALIAIVAIAVATVLVTAARRLLYVVPAARNGSPGSGKRSFRFIRVGAARSSIAAASITPVLFVLSALLVAVVVPLFSDRGGGSVSPMVVRALTDAGRLELRDIERSTATGAGASGTDSVAGPESRAGYQDESSSGADDDRRDYRFPGLLDRDFHFFMIEAYGYAVFSRDELRETLAPYLDRLEKVLREAGYGIRSNYLEAPVFGGFSWLSEATVLTGQEIDRQPKFEELIRIAKEKELPSLSRMLHEGGYYTLMVKPGTVHGPWPEGWDLFRFERSLIAHDGDFNYHGPWFSYVAVTDQHALWTTAGHLAEVRSPGGAAENRPVYVHYQLVSSHTPFNRIPPYIENWEDLGDGTVYHERSQEILTFNNTWGGGTELDEGYTASIAYVLTVLASYLEQFMDHERNPVLVFMGDHQPQRPIREQDAGPSVPVHIASRDREILAALEVEGYERGFYGSQLPPHGHMMDFYPMIARIATGGDRRSKSFSDRIDGQVDY